MTEEAPPMRAAWRVYLFALTLAVIVVILVPATVTDNAWRILLLKAFLIFALAFLPGWLYLQFIGVKGQTIYDEYVLNLHRLEIDIPANLPPPLPETPAYRQWQEQLPEGVEPGGDIYIQKFESVYGESVVPPARRLPQLSEQGRRRGRGLTEEIKRERFGPVLFATAVFTVGWAAVLQPELYGSLGFLREIELSGGPSIPAEPLRAGWIGAYVFVLQSLGRRYYQQDLKSRAYIGGVLRLVLVAALVVALHPVWELMPNSEGIELAFAFFLGFFPELGLRLLAHRIAVALRRKVDSGESQYPLRELDGCTLYAQARLLEEGVEDMQNLTSANIVDLMLNTRTPIARLVDWMDQAFLYLRVQGTTDGDGEQVPRDDRKLLRQYGVRTATDLCDLFEGAAPKGGEATFNARMLRLLNGKDAESDDELPSRVEGIYRSLANEPNLWHVKQWNRQEWLDGPADTTQAAGQNGHHPERVIDVTASTATVLEPTAVAAVRRGRPDQAPVPASRQETP